MTKCFLTTLLITSMTLGQAVQAHEFENERGSWELRAAFSGTVDPLGTEHLGTGFGLSASVSVNLTPRVGAYLGWTWRQFSEDDYYRQVREGIDTEGVGFTLGVQFRDQVRGWPSSRYRLRAGATTNRLRFEGIDQSITTVENELGWELEAALISSLGGNWKLIQALRFRTLDDSVLLVNNGGRVKLRSFGYHIGLGRTF